MASFGRQVLADDSQRLLNPDLCSLYRTRLGALGATVLPARTTEPHLPALLGDNYLQIVSLKDMAIDALHFVVPAFMLGRSKGNQVVGIPARLPLAFMVDLIPLRHLSLEMSIAGEMHRHHCATYPDARIPITPFPHSSGKGALTHPALTITPASKPQPFFQRGSDEPLIDSRFAGAHEPRIMLTAQASGLDRSVTRIYVALDVHIGRLAWQASVDK